ncbi:fumarylacetoacetate hydrolase family protein [Evansella clarkii]|uniref:fumarylacetoacetate hydrolase family protein n=1 Tax=Evansella clarkii TaxID=79879 RepID=UPI000B44CE61|nr:fumarylacetoacetate hydrolase family protein [Evansella clarkii]
MEEIKNIFCVGRNYAKHAKELGNEVPDEPILFSKPTHSLASADGSTIVFPAGRGEIHHELEIVLYIEKEIPHDFEVSDVVKKMALGIDFTLRDEQSELKKKGQPWLKAKGFRNSALITDFWDFPGEQQMKETEFSLIKNGDLVQKGSINDMMFGFKDIINYCNDYFCLGKGDIIYTGTPEGVGPIGNKDELKLVWGSEEKGAFRVKL